MTWRRQYVLNTIKDDLISLFYFQFPIACLFRTPLVVISNGGEDRLISCRALAVHASLLGLTGHLFPTYSISLRIAYPHHHYVPLSSHTPDVTCTRSTAVRDHFVIPVLTQQPALYSGDYRELTWGRKRRKRGCRS